MSAPVEHSAAEVLAGLDDAQATIAELWRLHDDPDKRRLAKRALQAVISAEATLRAADAFLLAGTAAERQATFEKLRAVACLRLGHDIRRTP